MIAMKRGDSKKQGLTLKIEDGAIVIRCPASVLPFCVNVAWDMTMNGGPLPASFKVIDEAGFAEDVLRELDREEEDGRTIVHQMVDAAICMAIENGSEHVQ